MNILRELRKIKKKSVMKKSFLALIFSFVFIANTLAWWNLSKEIEVKAIEGKVISWDVDYVVKDESILDETVNIPIENIMPGMENAQRQVKIINTGVLPTTIKYELISVKLFGVEMLDELKSTNGIKTTGNKTEIFTDKAKYPFNISYEYDKTTLRGEYVDESTTDSYATLNVNMNWEYDGKDQLDTEIGRKAYEFYNENLETNKNAIEVKVRITSEKLLEK